MQAAEKKSKEADYQRGKRAARLLMLMTSPEAFSVATRFQRHSIALTMVLLAVHIGCFVSTYMAAAEQTHVIKELNQAGHSVTLVHRVCLWTRVLDNVYRGRHAGATDQAELLYSPADLDKILVRMEADIDHFEEGHHDVFLGSQKLRRLRDRNGYQLYTLWETPIQQIVTWVDASTSYEETSDTTLWELVRQQAEASKACAWSHAS